VDDFDFYRLFKTLHVISVVLLGGGVVLEALAGALIARVRSVQEVRALAWMIYISENYLSIAAAIGIVVFGYLTADRLNLNLGTTWVLLGQILFYAIVVLAIAILRPAANELHRLAQNEPDGPVTAAISAQLKKPQAQIVGIATSIIFVFIIYLMVSKPDW
jgi:uncharacterized membrane protein